MNIASVRRQLDSLREEVEAQLTSRVDVSGLTAEEQVRTYLDGRCSDIDLSDKARAMAVFMHGKEGDNLTEAAALYSDLEATLSADVGAGIPGAWDRLQAAHRALQEPHEDWLEAVQAAWRKYVG